MNGAGIYTENLTRAEARRSDGEASAITSKVEYALATQATATYPKQCRKEHFKSICYTALPRSRAFAWRQRDVVVIRRKLSEFFRYAFLCGTLRCLFCRGRIHIG